MDDDDAIVDDDDDDDAKAPPNQATSVFTLLAFPSRLIYDERLFKNDGLKTNDYFTMTI